MTFPALVQGGPLPFSCSASHQLRPPRLQPLRPCAVQTAGHVSGGGFGRWLGAGDITSPEGLSSGAWSAGLVWRPSACAISWFPWLGCGPDVLSPFSEARAWGTAVLGEAVGGSEGAGAARTLTLGLCLALPAQRWPRDPSSSLLRHCLFSHIGCSPRDLKLC